VLDDEPLVVEGGALAVVVGDELSVGATIGVEELSVVAGADAVVSGAVLASEVWLGAVALDASVLLVSLCANANCTNENETIIVSAVIFFRYVFIWMINSTLLVIALEVPPTEVECYDG